MNLSIMKTSELKKVAKELKVKNWWLIKKAELISEITRLQAEVAPDEIIEDIVEDEKVEEKIIEDVAPESKKVVLNFKAEDVKPDEKTEDPKPETSKEFTLARMLEEIDMNGKKARRILRTKEVVKPGKQWAWDNEKTYNEIKALLIKS